MTAATRDTRAQRTLNTVPCKWCGAPTRSFGTKSCDGCWERNRHGDVPYDVLRKHHYALVDALREYATAYGNCGTPRQQAAADRARALLSQLDAA